MKTKSIKENFTNTLRLLCSWVLLLVLITVFSGCPKSPNPNLPIAPIFDSTAYKDSVALVNDSIYSLTGETQINIAGATISGDVFYNACQHVDMLFFVYPKVASNYSITCASINSGSIASVSLTSNGTYQTIPLSPSPHQFTARPEKISITDLNKFFSDLITVDGFDLKNHGADYWVNIKPDSTIQEDSIGYYFDIIISVSQKAPPHTESVTKGKVHPCPPCY